MSQQHGISCLEREREEVRERGTGWQGGQLSGISKVRLGLLDIER